MQNLLLKFASFRNINKHRNQAKKRVFPYYSKTGFQFTRHFLRNVGLTNTSTFNSSYTGASGLAVFNVELLHYTYAENYVTT